MLTATSRWLTYFTAVLYATLGLSLFFLPEQLAPVFAWKVTAFMTMTIGAWCLGFAWLAWITARRWKWQIVYSALICLWLFGILEAGVVFAFRGKLQLGHPIAWLYLTALTFNVLTAVVGFTDWLRIRPSLESSDLGFDKLQRGLILAFIIFVGFLGVYGLIASPGAPGTNGGIYPEVMSPFTLRSFAVFYLSLALSVFPHLWGRSRQALLHHSFAAYALIIIITIAACVYLRLFDFATRPGGLLYFGAYLIVGIPLFFVFMKHGTGRTKEE